MNEQPATECVYCGCRINAGTYPPFCCNDCEYWFNVEVEYDRTWNKTESNLLIEARRQVLKLLLKQKEHKQRKRSANKRENKAYLYGLLIRG